jgi:hypothetical protein
MAHFLSENDQSYSNRDNYGRHQEVIRVDSDPFTDLGSRMPFQALPLMPGAFPAQGLLGAPEEAPPTYTPHANTFEQIGQTPQSYAAPANDPNAKFAFHEAKPKNES